MGTRTMLVADADPSVLQEFRDILGTEWQVNWLGNGAAALAELKRRSYDVLVAGLDLSEMSGSELVNQARKRHPTVLRFVLAQEEDKSRVMKEVLGAHQFIVKPLDRATLKETIDRARALDMWIESESMRALVARVRSFPTVPEVYLELLNALRSPDITTEGVAEIIRKDMGISTKLLQVVNSAYFGLQDKITDLTQVVGLLGFETVRSMATAIKLLAHYDRIKLPNYSIDQLWAHSTTVARTAKQLMLMHTGNRVQAETAFMSGLMHDVGKVVLAANFDQQYNGAVSLAAKQELPLWDVEKEIFGATHGEVGAYLLGLWGMPLELTECAAFHHYPARCFKKEFCALTAVHVANALEYELNSGTNEVQKPRVDEEYLADLGVLACLPAWRMAVVSGDFSQPEIRTSSVTFRDAPSEAAAVSCATQPAAPAGPGQHAFPVAPPNWEPAHAEVEPQRRQGLVFAGVAALLLVGGVSGYVWLGHSHSNDAVAVESNIATVKARSLQPPEMTPVDAPSTSDEESRGAPSTPADTSAAVAPANADPDNVQQEAVPSPGVSTEPAFPELKLQGLFLNKVKPSAILNGTSVTVNERVGDVRVVSIGTSNVVVEFQNQQRTLSLK